MGTLSGIINMRNTQEEMERIRDAQHANQPREECRYWFVERQSKTRRGQWIFVRDFFGSKSDAAQLFCWQYRNQPIRYRLVHKLNYR